MSKLGLGGALAAILLAGCHSLLPFGGAAGTGDVTDAAPGDGLSMDEARDRPAGPLELGCQDTPPVVQTLASCSAGCSDTPPANCDGIPAVRDRPEFGGCNPLRYEETFAKGLSSWTAHPNVSGVWQSTCGKANVTAADSSVKWLVADATGVTTADYLVEARVEVGAIGDSKKWGVGVAGRLIWPKGSPDPQEYIICDLTLDEGSGRGVPMLKPDVRAWTLTAVGGSSGWPIDNADSPIPSTAGKVYYLQLWYANDVRKYGASVTCGCTPATYCPAVFCRVCTETGCPRAGFYGAYGNKCAYAPYVPTGPGTVAIRAYGRAARFDYVRVLGLANP